MPWKDEFAQCKPCLKYSSNSMKKIADLLKEFCSCSGEHLREMKNYVIVVGSDEDLRQIQQNDRYFFCAKGIDLESKILN